MTWSQAVIVYAVSWWMLLLIALPVGVKRQENPPPGIELAAPERTHLKIKCCVVTFAAALATWAIDIVIHSGIVAVK